MHLLDMQNLDILLCRNWIEKEEHMRSKPVTAQRFIINVFIACVVLTVTPLFGQLTWEQVVGDTASVPAGFGEWQNERYDSMAVYDGYLYVATYNWNTGTEVWRTADGTTWSQVNTDGFGDANNQGLSTIAEFNGYLYAGTTNTNTGGEVWRTNDGTTWAQVNTDGFGDGTNQGVTSMTVFGSSLYAGTRNGLTGVEVWSSANGTTWGQVNADGFDGDTNNLSASAMAVFNGSLYVGTGQTDFPTGTEVWSTPDGTTWNQVNTDGFGDASIQSTAAMQVYGAYLYLTSVSSSGIEVRRTNDGTTWSQTNTSGFGDSSNQSASSTLPIFDASIFVGTGNTTTGAEVWLLEGTIWAQANTDGFGDSGNRGATTMMVFNGYLYVGTTGKAEIWRSAAPPLFTDGFESGDTSAWSVTVGG
jgi:flagellin